MYFLITSLSGSVFLRRTTHSFVIKVWIVPLNIHWYLRAKIKLTFILPIAKLWFIAANSVYKHIVLEYSNIYGISGA